MPRSSTAACVRYSATEPGRGTVPLPGAAETVVPGQISRARAIKILGDRRLRHGGRKDAGRHDGFIERARLRGRVRIRYWWPLVRWRRFSLPHGAGQVFICQLLFLFEILSCCGDLHVEP